jgi:signal peptidase I
MNEPSATGRRPWVALVLSLFAAGLGHVYCGRIGTGLTFFFAFLLFAPFAVLIAWFGGSTAALVALILAFLAAVGVYLYAVIDSVRLAWRLRNQYQLKEYNSGLVYVLYLLVGLTYPSLVVYQLRGNVFEAFLIPTRSMVPNVLSGDHILVNKTAHPLQPLQRGEVIVHRSPENRQQTFVKRVIALAGDRVAVRKNEVFVNGKKLERERVPAGNLALIRRQATGEVLQEINAGRRYLVMLGGGKEPIPDYPEKTVPEGTCFVLGDNRDNSHDSRAFGFVPLGDVLGFVQYVYLPAETWTRFGVYRDWQ